MSLYQTLCGALPDQNWEIRFWLYKKETIMIQISHRDRVTMAVTRSTKAALSKSSGEDAAIEVIATSVKEAK